MTESLRNGRFVVQRLLGEGAQGRTFEAVDTREGCLVAIKRFDFRRARAWKDCELAEREARVLQSLSHPKLPRYIDHFEEDGALYLVMEKIEGESLAAIRRRGSPLGEDDVIRFLADAAEVLDYLHARSPQVIHRDLKPGNVIRRPDGSFAFVDFGSVRDKLRHEGGSTVVGTFGYMAPEQFQGRALPASDVYAIGATALAMLSGQEPETLPHEGLGIDVRAALRGRVERDLVQVLERTLEVNPDRRTTRLAEALRSLHPRSGRSPRGGVRDAARRCRGEPARRREQRRETRFADRVERGRQRRGRLPGPVAVVLALGVMVGIVAVTVATQVVVPLVLYVLSLFFARRPLRRAFGRVRGAGRNAVRALIRARRAIASAAWDVPADRVRVSVDGGVPLRGDNAHGREDADGEPETEPARQATQTRLG